MASEVPRHLLSTATLPYVPAHPDCKTLQWSDDLQACLVTRQELHILTPSVAAAVDTKNTALNGNPKGRQLPPHAATVNNSQQYFKWFRTSLNVENEMYWEYYTNEFRDTLVSSQSPIWKMASWSPRGVSKLGTCMLAGLTTYGEVFVFAPTNNPHRGKWDRVSTLPLILHNLLMPQFDATKQADDVYRLTISQLLQQLQIVSLDWSSSPIPYLSGNPASKSLLATGQRSGHVVLWARSDSYEMLPVARFYAAQSWITNLAFSGWSVSNGQATARLAVSSSDCCLTVWRIAQDLTKPLCSSSPSNPCLKSIIKSCQSVDPLRVHLEQQHVFDSQITALKWDHKSDSQQTLIFTRLGIAGIRPLNIDEASSCQINEFELQGVGDWQGVNPWSPCCGIFVSSVENSAIIALTDGSLHVLALGADAHLLPHEPLSLSTTLTAAMRQVNAENERYDPAGPVSKAQLFKTYAVAALPSGELSWFYELERPDMLIYKPEGSHASTLVVSDLAITKDVEWSKTLSSNQDVDLSPAASIFRFITSKKETLSNHLNAAEEELKRRSAQESTSTGSFAEALRHMWQQDPYYRNLQAILFFFSVTKRYWPADEEWDDVLENVQEKLASYIFACIERILLDNKAPSRDVEMLQMAQYALAGPEEDVSQAFSIQEHCAACQALIPFNDLRYATCENGHVWDRCSLTLEPINTLSARTCVGCGRKYMQLPPDAELSRSSLPDNEPKAPDGDELVEEVSTMNMDTEDWVGKEAAPHRLADVAKVVKTCIWCRSYTISAR